MSFREEDRKSNGVSRGLGLAAVAVGIGVGAAICYLFSKRQEHAEETHSEWQGGALTEEEQINLLRQQAYRERPWTAEECSICFEMMCRGQELMTLPCTHNFHQGCILPWIQERQTCPNCRKPIE